MKVTTGFGYYQNANGQIESKYILPIGDHSDLPDGLTQVEVADQPALDAIQLYIAPPSVDRQAADLDSQIQDQRNAFIDALIAEDTDTQASIKSTVAGLQNQKTSLMAQTQNASRQSLT